MFNTNDDDLSLPNLSLQQCVAMFLLGLWVLVIMYETLMATQFGCPSLITALSGAKLHSKEYYFWSRHWDFLPLTLLGFWLLLASFLAVVFGILLPLKKFGEWCVRQAALKRS
jgi:hypothetical protein